jgi:hypothetical protein
METPYKFGMLVTGMPKDAHAGWKEGYIGER